MTTSMRPIDRFLTPTDTKFMDLPTCPACGQSVLDDDVEDCPFCGASMTTGKPGKKPAPQPASAKDDRPPPQSSPQSSAVPAAAESQKVTKPDDDDDPFAIGSAPAAKAIPLKRKPARGRMYKVVCPMCETVGFVSPKAAGMDVRCVNPKCLVPVFTAPEIEKKPVEPEEVTPSDRPKGLVITLAVVGVAAVGFGVWYVAFRGGDVKQPRSEARLLKKAGLLTGDKSPTGSDGDSETGVGDQPSQKSDAAAKHAPKLPTLAEIQRTALETMVSASQQQTRNLSKPYCRRLTAEAFAHAGHLERAREQLERLDFVGRDVPFYRVVPLVRIAWQELAAGRNDAANKTLDEAFAAAGTLPEYGRISLDAATVLATALAAVGRADEAESLVAEHHDSGSLGQLSSALQVARAFQTYNLDAAAAKLLLPSSAPQRVAVTQSLAARGYWDEALNWAGRAARSEERTDCLVALAETRFMDRLPQKPGFSKKPGFLPLVSARNKQTLPSLDAVTQDLAAAGKARLYARAAWSQLDAGDKPRAEQLLKTARTALGSVPTPAAFTLPRMKELYSLKLPDLTPLRTGALAAAEIARVEAQLGRPEAAWKSLTTSLLFVRAMAPSRPAIQKRIDDVDKLGASVVRAELKRLLELDSEDQARIALRNYKKQCAMVRRAAEGRLGLQASLLARAADWNVRDQIWNEIRSRAGESALDRREPFLRTTLPWILADRFRRAGAADQAKAVQEVLAGSLGSAAFQKSRASYPVRWDALKMSTAQLIAAGNAGQAAKQIEAATRIEGMPIDKSRRLHWMLRLACRLVDAGEVGSAFQFVAAFGNSVWRQDAYEIVAAMAARNGHAHKLAAYIQGATLPPTERVAVCYGLVVGISMIASPGN